MDQYFKNKLNTCVNFIKNKITSTGGDEYKLIETKRKIYYYSKFSLNLDDFHQIYSFVKQIKENIFKNSLDTMKYCVKELVTFKRENIPEKEKILAMFTICYLHFYSNFSYDDNFSFEHYYTQDLINLCTRYGVQVLNLKQFKIFCYSFYYQLVKELKNLNYSPYKELYTFYNKDAKVDGDEEDHHDTKSNFVCYYKHYLSKISNFGEIKTNFQQMVTKKLVTPLISTTERVVDMILSIDSTNKAVKIQNEMEVDEDNQNKEETNPNDILIDHNNKSIYSKRILCELIKSENEEGPKDLLMNLSNKLDILIDLILNKHENKIHHIQQFMCYIVEINSELIKIIPEYENNTRDINLRFIMPAKNIYNYAVEIYFSIHDLYGMDVNIFLHLLKRKMKNIFDEKLSKSILYFYKIITDELLKNNNSANMTEILENVMNILFTYWQSEIIGKGQELTRFCAI